MLLSKLRLTLLAPLALLVAACGFEPVYAPGGSGAALQGQVLVDEPDSVITFRMVQEIEARLGRTATPVYRLTYDLTLEREEQSITAQNAILRYSLIGQMSYALIRISDGEVITSGNVEDFVSYSAAGTSLETLASERDADQRLAVALANLVTDELYNTVDLADAP